YSHIAAPMISLDRKNKENPKDTSILWNDEAQEAFDALKKAFTEAPVLSLPSEEGLFILDTDASAVAIAGILHQNQRDDDGVVRTRVISYGSRALTGPELKYSAAKSELMALVYFCNHYRQYLLGRSFVVRVDNQALVWLKTYSGDRSGQMVRWIQLLSEYHFVVDHRTRDKHMNADSLSKLPEYYQGLYDREIEFPPRKSVPFMTKKQWTGLPVYDRNSPNPEHQKMGKRRVDNSELPAPDPSEF
ncbi:MAG: hypothetical protein GY818_08640, partial [Planctomycetaceae bacterium]|nr:hypothetical protein [Planctomycetaceae bacterium]